MLACALALLTLTHAAPLQAELRPLWEAGGGLGLISFPDYRGSDERHFLALPFPYFIYRGERLKVDRQGVRGLLLDTRRYEFDFSMNATPPVDSENNRARQGMDDLDPTVEFGPSLILKLLRNEQRDISLELRLPLRASVAVDLTHLHNAGFVFQPNLALDFYNLKGWKLGFLAGAVFGDRRQHHYFYGVAPEFANTGRAAYEAHGGYGGNYMTVALRRRLDRWWIAAFARADDLHNATFRDSPLVRSDRAYYAGLAFAYVFAESAERVESNDLE